MVNAITHKDIKSPRLPKQGFVAGGCDDFGGADEEGFGAVLAERGGYECGCVRWC